MKSEPSRTFIGSVLCIDLVGYSKRTVDEQIEVKSAFNRLLSQVIKAVRPDDRIILDTGDGAAVTFLGDPDECLKVGLELRDKLMESAEHLGARSGEGPVRIGMNLGPLRVAVDMNGHPNIIGDGLNAAERVMSFAQPGQIVASRGFHEMLSRLSAENATMFRYEGKHVDKNAREHEIYIVEDRRRVRRAAAAKTAARKAQAEAPVAEESAPEPAPPPVVAAKPVEAPRPDPVAPKAAAAKTVAPKPAAPIVPPAQPAVRATPEGALVTFLRNPVMVWATGIALVVLIFAEAWLLDQKGQAAGDKVAVASPAAPATKPPPVAEAKAVPAETKPVPAETKPVANDPKRGPPEAKPIVNEAKPAPADAKPAAIDTKPAIAQGKPAPIETKASPAPKIEAPPPAPAKEPARKPERKAEPDSRVAATKPTPAYPVPQAEPAPAPLPAPPPAAPPPAPVQVAAVTPVTRVPVQFPRAAAQQGLETGTVRARLSINAEGRVTNVTVLGSSSRLFDREAVRALEEWRFNAGAGQRSYEVEIEFKR